MAYVTLEEVKYKIGKENLSTFEESRITYFIDWSKSVLDSFIGPVDKADRDEEVDYEFVYNKNNIREWQSKYVQVNTINSINGVTFTWTPGTDIKIIDRLHNRVQIKDLFSSDYSLTENDFPTFTVNMNTGWEDANIPETIKYAQLALIEWAFRSENGQTVTKKKIGDKELNFQNEDSAQQFQSNINLYMPVSV